MENQWNMLQAELERRGVPKIALPRESEAREKRLEEIRNLLCRELYGYAPGFPLKVEGAETKRDDNGYGGKAVILQLEIRVTSPFAYTSFPACVALPKGKAKPPLFLHYTFTNAAGDGMGEEIIDRGYGLASVYYEAVTPDKDDSFLNGAGAFCRRNPYDSWGKIAIWAWAGSRLLDVCLEKELADPKRIAVVGHSRLGKTALLAGALDRRFSMVVSNDSGCGGIALYRGKKGEQLADLKKNAGYWFCGNMADLVGREEEMPFDAHYLAALTAPGHLYVASASEDAWADPKSEFLACVAGSEAYETLGLRGLVCPDRYPEPGEAFPEGHIGYHLRKGTHYLAREDWHHFMEYREKHNI